MKKGQRLKVEKPKQYQQGWTEFYKLKFLITEETLIPRPETELLVDEVVKLANGISQMADGQKQKSMRHEPSAISIIDIGTGSGNIAISIAKNLPQAKIIATDISAKALEVARKNAEFHHAERNLFFIESNLLSAFHPRGGARLHPKGVSVKDTKDINPNPDIIVANLPYIPTARLLHIDPMVTDWEPKVALDGGIDGFELYRKLFTQIEQKKLYPKYLIGEIDYTQAELVLQETKKRFPNAKVEIKEDFAKMLRYFVIKIEYYKT